MTETRTGFKYVYTLQPGEDWRVTTGGILIVVHPERKPKMVHPDGKVEEISP